MRTTRTTSRTVLLKPCNLAETKRAVKDGINNIIWQYTLHNWNQAIHAYGKWCKETRTLLKSLKHGLSLGLANLLVPQLVLLAVPEGEWVG